jgi:hypothetical protein
MAEVLQFPRGAVILLTSGSYSDAQTNGLLVLLQDCSLPALAQRFAEEERARLKANPDDSRLWDCESPEDFGGWLIAQGIAMPVDYTEVHTHEGLSWEREFNVPEYDEEEEASV